MAKLIDGKAVSASVRAQVAEEVEQLKQQGVTPGLAVVIVGEDVYKRQIWSCSQKWRMPMACR